MTPVTHTAFVTFQTIPHMYITTGGQPSYGSHYTPVMCGRVSLSSGKKPSPMCVCADKLVLDYVYRILTYWGKQVGWEKQPGKGVFWVTGNNLVNQRNVRSGKGVFRVTGNKLVNR